MIIQKALSLLATGLLFMTVNCDKERNSAKSEMQASKTWGERLGFPKDKRVLILHADDSGMCAEANQATEQYLQADEIQSTSIMMPCPHAQTFLAWALEHPEKDVGLHLTLTSEWKTYRWGPVADPKKVTGLLDPDGYMWPDVLRVVKNTSPEEVETELRAQIDEALALGLKPGHLDTHMGTVYGSLAFTRAYLKLAVEYNIPAMVIEFSEPVMERFRQQGYPINDELMAEIAKYPLPKLDDFQSIENASTYEQKKQQFYTQVRSLQPGITEIIFHPSVETDNLKAITNSWQQRVWEAQMFSDPEVRQFLEQEGVLFTNWKEMVARFREG